MMNSTSGNYNMTLTPGLMDGSLKAGAAQEYGLGASGVSTFPGSWGGATAFDGSSPISAAPDAFYVLSASRNSAADDTYTSALTNYPRIITAMQLLEEESDDGSVFCGPPSEPGESGQAEIRHLKNLGVHIPEESKPGARLREAARLNREAREAAREARETELGRAERREAAREGREPRDARGDPRAGREPRDAREAREPRRQSADDQEAREPGEKPVNHRRPQPLIAPRGEINDDNQKFICVFQIGLEDDEEFCLVKRILGKAGNNMRRIAEECSAKVRLRGIGSGFLEGSDGKEANMPLQLNVSCTDFESYQGAVDRVATLLKELYKHYRRYARSRAMEVPDVKVSLEEVRRDDLAMDLLSQKAQRSPSQRERDRRQREKERQLQREREREKEKQKELDRAALESDNSEGDVPWGAPQRKRSRERLRDREDKEQRREEEEKAVAKAKALPTVLPGGLPVPTTPAGRRLAAKAGGAEAAAIVSAVARQQEREERDRLRKERDEQRDREREERDRKKKEAAERAAIVASRAGRTGTRGKPKGGAAASFADSGAADPPGKGAAKGKEGKGKASVPAKAPPPPPPGPPPADALEIIHAVPSASKDWSGWGSSSGMKSDWQDSRAKPKSSSKRK